MLDIKFKLKKNSVPMVLCLSWPRYKNGTYFSIGKTLSIFEPKVSIEDYTDRNVRTPLPHLTR